MSKRPNRAQTSGKDPHYVHTSRDGRKYIKPNEIIRLDEFKERVKRLRDVMKDSNLVKGP